jgi:hypothetical protein
MRKIAKSQHCGCINKIIDNNVMSKPNTIDADYLGLCMCLNPPGMLYMLVDIISLSFIHLTFKQPDTRYVEASGFR